MISLEEVRQAVIGNFQTVHEAQYPTTLAEYPNFSVVDIEHQKEPFVKVELDLKDIEQAAIGERELLVPGVLRVYFYYREGQGMSGAYSYTDALNTYLGMTQIGAIWYHAAKPMNIKTFPGWEGCLNTIKFDVVKNLVC